MCSKTVIPKVDDVYKLVQKLTQHHVYVVLARQIENVSGTLLRHLTGLVDLEFLNLNNRGGTDKGSERGASSDL